MSSPTPLTPKTLQIALEKGHPQYNQKGDGNDLNPVAIALHIRAPA